MLLLGDIVIFTSALGLLRVLEPALLALGFDLEKVTSALKGLSSSALLFEALLAGRTAEEQAERGSEAHGQWETLYDAVAAVECHLELENGVHKGWGDICQAWHRCAAQCAAIEAAVVMNE